MTEGFILLSTNPLPSFGLLVEMFELISQAFPFINSEGPQCNELSTFPPENKSENQVLTENESFVNF